jgi:tetrahydromethanopterin S-methyltransferase subunit G
MSTEHNMRSECRAKFDNLKEKLQEMERRLRDGDIKFFNFSTQMAEVIAELKALRQLNEKLDKVIDNSGFTLKQLIGYAITFALGVLGTVIALLLKGGG